jgi:hypothetical protein
MPLKFDFAHVFWAVAGALVGVIYGYVFGIEIYLIKIAIFAPSTSVSTAIAHAGVFPMLIALLLGLQNERKPRLF